MIGFYTFFVIFLIIYFYFCFYKENFTNINNKNIILLGDSILENSSYANPSVFEILEENHSSVLCLAQDNSTIEYTYSQIHDIPIILNNRNSYIFISVGGNDILNKYVYKDIESSKQENINKIFQEYKSLVLSLHKKMNLSNIIILNIYYPFSSYYKSYYSLIREWNDLLKELCEKNKFKLLDIAAFMKAEEDFSFDIEPSSIGSQKISKAILISL